MGALLVKEPGLLSTVQDLGRHGWTQLGVVPGGAADPVSHRLVNRACGNHDNAPTLEMTLTGAVLECREATTVVLSPGAPKASIVTPGAADAPVVPWVRTNLRAGQTLRVGPIVDRARAYMAITGGISAPTLMGGAGVCLSAGFGGVFGRAIRAGDVLHGVGLPPLPAQHHPQVDQGAIDRLRALMPPHNPADPVRCVPGAQFAAFDDSAREQFFAGTLAVSLQSDRAGLRLEGPPLAAPAGGAMLSEGMPCGAIEVPPDGRPIVLLSDHPVTGGYPVLACVIAADLPRLGRIRPRDAVRFELVSLERARTLYREQESALQAAFPNA